MLPTGRQVEARGLGLALKFQLMIQTALDLPTLNSFFSREAMHKAKATNLLNFSFF